MNRIPILILTLLAFSCGGYDIPNESPPTQYTRESVKNLLERSHANSTVGWQSREALRSQMKVVTLTVLATLVGFAWGKNKENGNEKENEQGKKRKYGLFGLAAIFCLFMYGLDTQLLDISLRETRFRGEVNSYLLRIDSLSPEGLDSAVTRVYGGIDPPNKCGKVELLFTPRLVEWFWYGVPFLFTCIPSLRYWWRHKGSLWAASGGRA